MEWFYNILYVVLVATVPVVAKFVIAYLVAKRKEVETSTENQIFADTLLEAIDLVEKAVDTTSQTFVDSLKQSGTFDEAAQKEAFDKSFQSVKNLMSTETKDILQTVYNDLDGWIKLQIESYIKSQKKEK